MSEDKPKAKSFFQAFVEIKLRRDAERIARALSEAPSPPGASGFLTSAIDAARSSFDPPSSMGAMDTRGMALPSDHRSESIDDIVYAPLSPPPPPAEPPRSEPEQPSDEPAHSPEGHVPADWVEAVPALLFGVFGFACGFDG